MKQEEILDMFRREAEKIPTRFAKPNAVILELAQLLADSRGRLSKENFETLVSIGAVLYKEGRNQFQARSDVTAIMKHSAGDRRQD